MEDMKNDLEILYEDNHVIVVVKKPNVLSQSDNTKDIDMLTIIKDYLKKKYNKKGNVYLGLVHRLDRPTGGIMVFAKTSKAASRLSKQLQDKIFKKKYLAVIPNFNIKKGTFIDYLKKDNNNNSIVTTKEKGKMAKLEFKIIKTIDNLSLVEVILYTGRHHQIRVQFNERGYPLYGDMRYGNINKKAQLALFAYDLQFIHPVTKEIMHFKKYPSYGVFNNFKEVFR